MSIIFWVKFVGLFFSSLNIFFQILSRYFPHSLPTLLTYPDNIGIPNPNTHSLWVLAGVITTFKGSQNWSSHATALYPGKVQHLFLTKTCVLWCWDLEPVRSKSWDGQRTCNLCTIGKSSSKALFYHVYTVIR